MSKRSTGLRSIPLTICVGIVLVYDASLVIYEALPCCLFVVLRQSAGDANGYIAWLAVEFLLRICLLGAALGILRWNREAVWVYSTFAVLSLLWSVAHKVYPLWMGSLDVLFTVMLVAVLWASPTDWRQFQ